MDNWRVEDIYNVIFSLGNSKSVDVYCLNSRVLKLTAPYSVEIVTYVFNHCLDNYMFPQCLKLSNVELLFNKGGNSDFYNYRTLSIILVVGKAFDILFHTIVIGFHYSCRPKLSTSNAIVNFKNGCMDDLLAKNNVCIIK